MAFQPTRELPPQLATQWKSLQKHYEQKSYRRALKVADSILKLEPFHGETYSMKALIEWQLEKKKDAFDLARKGLTYDPRSYLCWHIMGILYRSHKLFLDASICFETSLIYRKDSLQVLTDLANMLIQIRNYPSYLKVSNKLLTTKSKSNSNVRGTWSAFAVAAHLAGDFEKAVHIIDAYDSSIEKTEADRFERSEFLFYKIQIIEESGDVKRALEELEKNSFVIVDKEEWKSKRAEYLMKLSRFQESAQQYQILIKGNPDNWLYYTGLFKALHLIPLDQVSLRDSISLPKSQTEQLVELCDKLAKENPFSKTPRQIPLCFVSGPDFKLRFQKFLFPSLTKGIPSLYVLVQYLYKDSAKATAIGEILLEVEKNLITIKKLSPSEELEEPPSTLLWTWYFLAEHFNHLFQTKTALEYAEKCQAHTPTVLDFELLKAKIYKNAGDLVTAAKHVEDARTYDLADRYLNTKATRSFLRADNVQRAAETFSIFTKVDTDLKNSHRNNVFEMQVMWYEYEEGKSWLRQGNLGKALKRFVDIEKHFLDIHYDQLDFHSFCHGKMTLRQYIRMLRLEDRIFGHEFYFKAACEIVKIYLNLYLSLHPADLEKLPENERKKILSKQKRQAERKNNEEGQKQNPNKGGNISLDDPNGEKLVNVPDTLGEAHKYLQKLLYFSDSRLETHLLGFEVAIHRKKYLLALRSVIQGLKLAPGHPEVHIATVKFFHTVFSLSLPPNIKQVIDIEANSILQGTSLDQYNISYLDAHFHTVAGRRAHFVCAHLMDSQKKEKYLPNLVNTDDPGFPLEECICVHKLLLKEFGEKIAGDYKNQCQLLFPYARYFSDKVVETAEIDQQNNEKKRLN